jgi:undecaprenyl-diphosphatase
MTLLQALLLGFVQGLTEFLPVSSSGHLVLFQDWLGFTGHGLLFDVSVHFATLIAVVIFFAKDILKLRWKTVLPIVVGTIPIVVVGLLFKSWVEMLFDLPVLVAAALIVTGLINLWTDRKLESVGGKETRAESKAKSKPELASFPTWKQGLIIGFFQAVAIVPGISRSGSTLAGAIWQKIDRQTAFTFSFLLSIPAVGGAALLQVIEVAQAGTITIPIQMLLVGGFAAGLTGYASLWMLKMIITQARLEVFGWYCVAVGVASLVLLLI